MNTSQVNLIWANKPDCSLPVAEFWISEDKLWLTIFLDDNDGKLKIELLPSLREAAGYLVDLTEIERLIETAKRDLLAMVRTQE